MRSVTEYRQAYRQADDMMMKIIKIAYFSTPLSFGAPLPMFPLEFCSGINHKEIRVMQGAILW